MKEKLKHINKQNKGSTLIVVLAIVSFVSILAVVVSQAALVNYKMKVVDKQSQKVFYNSEDAVDEIYVALGMISMNCFDEAYNTELESLVRPFEDGSMSDYMYTPSNLTMNQEIRTEYIYNVLKELGIYDESITKEDSDKMLNSINSETKDLSQNKNDSVSINFTGKLNTFLENKIDENENGEVFNVQSVDKMTLKKYKSQAGTDVKTIYTYSLVFNDCIIKYKNDRGFYSYITFDGEVAMPDAVINFTVDTKPGLDGFTNYALVGNTGIIVGENKTLNLNGNAFAGKGANIGLTLYSGSALNVNGYNVISGGDICVTDATLTAGNSELWCENIVTENAVGTAPVINITGTKVYVHDDMQLNGDNSTVNISDSEYYGYSHQINSEANHLKSSAIIVNGSHARLSLNAMSTLVLGGRAYIEYDNEGSQFYATGESISLKGSQEMYMVPSYLMSLSNPAVKDADVEVDITENNFFGYTYLDETEPYTTKVVGDMRYYYLNFRDYESAAHYVETVMNTEAYNAVLDLIGAGKTDDQKVSLRKEYDKSRNYVRLLLNSNLSELMSTTAVENNVLSYINGQIVSVNIGQDANGENVMNFSSLGGTELADDDFYNDCYMDYSSLITILKKYDGITNLKNYTKNVFANMISMEYFGNLTGGEPYVSEEDGLEGVLCCAINNNNKAITIKEVPGETRKVIRDDKGNIIVNTGVSNQGLIVTSGNINVESDFRGTIISGGRITVSENVTVVGDNTLVNSILAADEKMRKLFSSESITASDELKDITYKDFVEFTNWRKYEETE